MLIRTHLAITVLAILILIPFVNNKLIFIIIALFSTFIPDIDSRYSKLGKKKIFRPAQFITKHRGILHSFSLLFLLSLIIIHFYPVIALPFFVGYGLHLLADSLTLNGIQPFYPIRGKISGFIKTGGYFEKIVLITIVGISLILFLIEIQKYT